MAAVLTFYYFPSLSSLSFCLFLSFTLFLSFRHAHSRFPLAITQMSACRPWQLNDREADLTLTPSESEVTVIKGCSELLLALGHSLMNDMKQRWDAGVEEWWRTGDSSPHTALTCAEPGKRSAQGSRLNIQFGSRLHAAELRIRCAHKQRAHKSKHTATYKHKLSEDSLSKGCVYCRINQQLFHYIIHVQSRPVSTPGQLAPFFFFFFSHLPLTLALIPGLCSDTNPSDNSA